MSRLTVVLLCVHIYMSPRLWWSNVFLGIGVQSFVHSMKLGALLKACETLRSVLRDAQHLSVCPYSPYLPYGELLLVTRNICRERNGSRYMCTPRSRTLLYIYITWEPHMHPQHESQVLLNLLWCWIPHSEIHSKLHNINVLNATPSLVSWNPSLHISRVLTFKLTTKAIKPHACTHQVVIIGIIVVIAMFQLLHNVTCCSNSLFNHLSKHCKTP